MLKVQVLNNISSLGLDKFSSDIYDVSVKDNNPDAIPVSYTHLTLPTNREV